MRRVLLGRIGKLYLQAEYASNKHSPFGHNKLVRRLFDPADEDDPVQTKMAFRLAQVTVGDQINHIVGRQHLEWNDHAVGLYPFRIDV